MRGNGLNRQQLHKQTRLCRNVTKVIIELYDSPSSCSKASYTSVSCMKRHLRDRNPLRLSLCGWALPMKLHRVYVVVQRDETVKVYLMQCSGLLNVPQCGLKRVLELKVHKIFHIISDFCLLSSFYAKLIFNCR